LLPESSFIPLKNDVIFEHRLYLPMVGFSFFLTGAIYYRFAVKTVKIASIILVALVICYSMLTYARNYVWSDNFRLWDDTVHKSPQKARPYMQRGDAYLDAGFIDSAILDYTTAIRLAPSLVIGYYNRGNAYSAKDCLDEAIKDYNKALELNPKFAKAYHNRAAAYFCKKEYQKSREDLNRVENLRYPCKPELVKALQESLSTKR
jgi:tetratricopeptide (TPR) repeat protein